ncbi:hypothetical protein [uncultured Cohaesibacter sp.]|uniref:hypothetical protein n=1 Tax=uncultured Cohaesibacter sp. TaxID=1002546 RepID=UPI0029C878B5|nr:hypothetical protein [uncultured Cohaesibacter sp.]
MTESSLIPDCQNCAALCCICLAFDKSDAFPIDKPNGEPCPQLTEGQSCKIYEEREQQGYRGCMHFDCLGAGQQVTQEVFGGRNWRDDSRLVAPMTRAFVIMLKIHQLMGLLQTASQLPLTYDEMDRFDVLMADLEPVDGWSEERLEGFEAQGTEAAVHAFLKSLRHHVA